MHEPITRRAYLGLAAGALLAGCVEAGDDLGPGEPATKPISEPVEGGSPAVGTHRSFDSATADGSPPTAEETLPFPESRSSLREAAVSGGPPKDGIPAIDDPSFVDRGATDDFLDPGDVVFGVAGEGTAKAYPQKILVHHEIVNDEIAGHPASVTYCPLTGTPMGFWRGDTTFGVSGRLVNSNLVMYDRATEAWWPQMLATAVPGPWNDDPPGQSLAEFRVVWTTWGLWRERFPETAVLSRDTGFARNYDRDPYGSYNPRGGYYDREGTMFPALNEDDRLPDKRMVLGVRTPDGATCFLKDALRERDLVTGHLGGESLLAVYDRGLDTGFVYRNPDGEDFGYEDGAAVDPDGNVHPPDDLPLPRVLAFDSMWFAWAGFYPGTAVHE